MVSTHSSSSGETESESESEPMKTSKPAPTSSSSSEESESESEPNTTSTPKVKTMPIEPAKSSSSEEESDSESEPEKEPSTTSTPKVTTMPIEPAKSSSSEESESESEPEAVEIDQSKAAGKRPMSDTEAGDAKRPKMETVILQKQLFQRLYSEENEIELIQGMITFVQQNGKDPLSDAPHFYEFVKGSLTVDVNYKQLLSKIRKLKLKFRNNAVKIQTNGKVKSLNNVHEKKMFELSEKVWGNDVRSLKKVKTVSFGNGSEEVKPNLVSRNKSNIPDEITRRIGFEKVSDADKDEMEKKWKDIKVKELELYITKVSLMKEQAEILLNATIKSGNC